MNNPLVQPDPGLYIWTIVTFLVLRGAAGEVRLAAAARRRSTQRQDVDPQVARRRAAGASRSSSGCTPSRRRILAQARAEAEAIISRDAVRRRTGSARR